MTQEKQLSGKAAIAQLAKMGFSDAIIEEPRRLIVSIEGRDGVGKSNFGFTAPAPVFDFNIDCGTEGVVGKFQRQGKQIFVKHVRIPKGEPQETYRAVWQDTKSQIELAYKVGEGTVMWDTATELHELSRLAAFGKLTQVLPHHYGPVNSEWRELIRLAYDSKMSTVFIHKTKAVYINEKRTGDYELAGFSEMPYLVQVSLAAGKQRKEDGNGVDFFWTVKKCRPNPSIEGSMFKGVMPDGTSMTSFDWLMGQVFDD